MQWVRKLLYRSRCKRRKAGSGSSRKGKGHCQALKQDRQAHEVQARIAQTHKERSSFPHSSPLLLSNSQHSVGHFIHWQAKEMTCTFTNTHSQANHIYTRTQKPQNKLFLFFATIGTSWNAGGWVSARAIRPQNKPKPFGAMWHPEVPHNLKKDGEDDRVIAVRPSHPSWPHFLTPVKSRASEENKGFNAYIVPSEARQTSRQAQNPRTSRREKFKVTSTHPVSDSKQRGKWGHNQQVPPFTYMKAQREGRHRFKSASSNRRRGGHFSM